MVRRALIAVSAVFAVSSVAGAQKFIGSPAQDLFDQATFYLDTQYFGPSKINLQELFAKYQARLDEVCAPLGLQCGFDKVEPLLEELFDEIQDPHAYYQTAAAAAAERQQATGTVTTPSPRLGFSHAGFLEYQSQTLAFGAFNQTVTNLISGGQAKLLSQDRIVLNVVSGSPAEKAGFRYGDRWIGYNNTLFSSFTNLTDYTNFLAALAPKVAAKETITMNFLRGANKQRVDIPITGDIINAAPFPTMTITEDNIAMLRISDYLVQGLGQQVHNLLRQAVTRNPKAIVVNMRGNGGGFGSERMISMGAFIENPEPMRRVPRYNAETTTTEEVWLNATGTYLVRNLKGVELGRQTIQNPTLYKGPVVVLVDEGCASACEYFASGIQRAKRGPVVGTPTVGIGDTNSARIPLANGGNAAMPTLRAFWPDGTPLPSRVTPDIATPNAEFELFNTGRDPGVDKGLAAQSILTSSNTSSLEAITSAPLPSAQPLSLFERHRLGGLNTTN
jgi:carboxyl-terminal processing protease